MKKLLAAPVLLAFMVVAPSVAEEPSANEELRAWAKDFVATWVGESTLEKDVPGLGKKGDATRSKATAKPYRGVYQITIETQVNGKVVDSGAGTVGWDPSLKAVRLETFSKLGSRLSITYARKGETWTCKLVSIEPDGTKATSDGTLTKTKTTHTWLSTNRKHGGDSLPDRKQTFTKQ